MASMYAALTQTPEGRRMMASAELRSRALALLNAALDRSGMTKRELADVLGVGKSAVSSVLKGNGNVRIDTLAEYLDALGFEVDMAAVLSGEIKAARVERRGPRRVELTAHDAWRVSVSSGQKTVYRGEMPIMALVDGKGLHESTITTISEFSPVDIISSPHIDWYEKISDGESIAIHQKSPRSRWSGEHGADVLGDHEDVYVETSNEQIVAAAGPAAVADVFHSTIGVKR